MHTWGDNWFKEHGPKLQESIDYCMAFWIKWGRIGTQGKEKYGTFRDHPYFYNGWWAIHELINPGYVYYQWPKLIYKIDLFLGQIVQKLRLYIPIRYYQGIIYNYTIQQCCKKYPEIIIELVRDLEYPHLIKPGIFGKIDGQVIHDSFWKKSN